MQYYCILYIIQSFKFILKVLTKYKCQIELFQYLLYLDNSNIRFFLVFFFHSL